MQPVHIDDLSIFRIYIYSYIRSITCPLERILHLRELKIFFIFWCSFNSHDCKFREDLYFTHLKKNVRLISTNICVCVSLKNTSCCGRKKKCGNRKPNNQGYQIERHSFVEYDRCKKRNNNIRNWMKEPPASQSVKKSCASRRTTTHRKKCFSSIFGVFLASSKSNFRSTHNDR